MCLERRVNEGRAGAMPGVAREISSENAVVGGASYAGLALFLIVGQGYRLVVTSVKSPCSRPGTARVARSDEVGARRKERGPSCRLAMHQIARASVGWERQGNGSNRPKAVFAQKGNRTFRNA